VASLSVPDCLQDYLVDEGVCQMPDDTGSLPVVYSTPRMGLGEPTEDSPVLLGIWDVDHASAPGYLVDWRYPVVELLYRSTTAGAAQDLDETIRVLIDEAHLLQLGDLDTLSIRLWRGRQRILQTQVKNLYVYSTQYRIHLSAKALQI